MKRNTKKTLLIGSASLLAVVLGVTVVSHSAANEGLFAYMAKAANDPVTSSIVFSRDGGSFTKIDNTTASVSGTTSSGATYYAVSHNIADISETNYVAQFGAGVGTEFQYVSFSTSPTGTDDFEFQGITGIKVHTTSGSSQTMYLRYSTNGESFSSQETISASNNPDKYTFGSAHKYVRLVGYSTYARNITRIELFYTCTPGGEPEPEKQVTLLEVTGNKTVYAQGSSFVEPTVTAYYSDSTHEVVSGATFTGFDSSTLIESQTITVSYGGQSTSYTIKVRPTETSKHISYVGFDVTESQYIELSTFLNLNSSTLTAYAEPYSTATFTPVCKTGWTILGIDDESGDIVPEENDGVYSFTMPNGDVVLNFYVRYQEVAPTPVGIRVDNPKTEYFVGDEFVSPDVYVVYDNDSEVLIISDIEFTGFDSSSEVASQTISVSYNNGEFSTSYTISISEGSGSEDVFQFATYEYATSSTRANIYRFTFNSDGSASYERYQKNDTYPKGAVVGKINLTYTIVNGIITLTFDAFDQRETTGNPQTSSMSDFASYRLFNTGTPTKGVTNVTASYANGVVSIKLYNSSYVQNANATNFEIYNAE